MYHDVSTIVNDGLSLPEMHEYRILQGIEFCAGSMPWANVVDNSGPEYRKQPVQNTLSISMRTTKKLVPNSFSLLRKRIGLR